MTMLEKAARAGDEALFKEHGVMLGRETSRTFVIAVLRAIREPANTVLQLAPRHECHADGEGSAWIDEDDVKTNWQLTLDAILAEQGEGAKPRT